MKLCHLYLIIKELNIPGELHCNHAEIKEGIEYCGFDGTCNYQEKTT